MWQKDGGPVYPGTAGIKYVNAQHIRNGATRIFYMDFLNTGSQEQFSRIQQQYPDADIPITQTNVTANPRYSQTPDYQSGHFDEPNILAHFRTTDRTIDGKKTLFVEEIQSD